MQITRKQLNPTTVTLTISADGADLQAIKQTVLKRLAHEVKLSGFRPGKAPLGLVERKINPAVLRTEFLDTALNRLYGRALDQEKVRPVAQPKVELGKFEPFSALEFTAEIAVVGDIALPDYKKLKVTKKAAKASDKDVDEVIQHIQRQAAEKTPVERAAKDGDEVTIDFAGKDAETGEAVRGADGKGYPLLLGSNTFIPGFEANLVGLKAGEQKTFTVKFPKDYGVKALQSRKVTFDTTVTEVREIIEPEADDALAAKAGPYKSIAELRDDIRKELTAQKEAEAERAYQQELIDKLAAGTTMAIPDVLIDEEVARAERDMRQNLTYRGKTWKEYLEELGQDEDAYRASARGPAEEHVKTGLALSEVAEREQITVTPEELRQRLRLLKAQYRDPAMQAELEKPASVRTVMSAMLTEKTVAVLEAYASKG